MEFNLGDSPVTSHSWNANRTRKFDIISPYHKMYLYSLLN